MSSQEERLKELLHEVLDERQRIDEPTHRRDHAWIEAMIHKEEARAAAWGRIQEFVLQWSIITLLGAFLIWLGFDRYIK